MIDRFNSPGNPARLFLLGTKAANMGINLYKANRVILFDVSWNPSNDIQAIHRAYRLGQKKVLLIIPVSFLLFTPSS
jgi:SNF2 family DNA or RNA helicase